MLGLKERPGGREIVMVEVVDGDLLQQSVEVIVNAWNRNVIPHWLLVPQGVSGAIRKRAGSEPFRELRRHGILSAGAAVLTGAGKLPYKGIIHVAGIGLLWISNEKNIRLSVRNALNLARGRFTSIAFPLIGIGGMNPDRVEAIMLDEAARCDFPGEVRIVRYASETGNSQTREEKLREMRAHIPSELKLANDFIMNGNCTDFTLDAFDGSTLRIVGSFDLSYYHEIEILFVEVHSLDTATFFMVDNQKPAFFLDGREEEGAHFVILDDEGNRHRIVCEFIETRIGTVRYFDDEGRRLPPTGKSLWTFPDSRFPPVH